MRRQLCIGHFCGGGGGGGGFRNFSFQGFRSADLGIACFFFAFSSDNFCKAAFSALLIFFVSSLSDATSSVKYSSMIFQPAFDLSAILMCLFFVFSFFIVSFRRLLVRFPDLFAVASNSALIWVLNSNCTLLDWYLNSDIFSLFATRNAFG